MPSSLGSKISIARINEVVHYVFGIYHSSRASSIIEWLLLVTVAKDDPR